MTKRRSIQETSKSKKKKGYEKPARFNSNKTVDHYFCSRVTLGKGTLHIEGFFTMTRFLRQSRHHPLMSILNVLKDIKEPRFGRVGRHRNFFYQTIVDVTSVNR